MLLFIGIRKRSITTLSLSFNTSHVTLYRPLLMDNGLVAYRFNTSHVTLYRFLPSSSTRSQRVSIHHMLLFIALQRLQDLYLYSFQYITCYSLSWISRQRWRGHCRFQYITCYSLSVPSQSFSLAKYRFQYITCYSLSNSIILRTDQSGVSIHHMLLFIQSRQRTRFLVWSVSIHHMLLFIATEESENPPEKLFQYITCYFLSVFLFQNHGFQELFQYITCYSLSVHTCELLRTETSFNTSHVTLYQK